MWLAAVFEAKALEVSVSVMIMSSISNTGKLDQLDSCRWQLAMNIAKKGS